MTWPLVAAARRRRPQGPRRPAVLDLGDLVERAGAALLRRLVARPDLLSGRQRHGAGRSSRRPRRDHHAAHLGRGIAAHRLQRRLPGQLLPLGGGRRTRSALAVTGHRPAAFVGGLVFGFHPFRAAHLEHVELLSSYWLAVALLCLHRWVRTRSRWPLAGLALALTLQALTSGYYFFYAMLLVAGWIAWFALRQSSWSQLAELAAALAAPVLAIAPVLWRYRDGARRARVGTIRLRGRAAERRHRRLRRDAVVPRLLEPADRAGQSGGGALSGPHRDRRGRCWRSDCEPMRRRCRRSGGGSAWPASAWPSSRPPSRWRRRRSGPFAYRLGPIRFSVSNLYKPMSVAAVFALGVAGDAAPRPRRLGPPFAVRLLRPGHAGDVAAGRRPDGAVPRRARALQGALWLADAAARLLRIAARPGPLRDAGGDDPRGRGRARA